MQYIEKGQEPLRLKKYKEITRACFDDLEKDVKYEIKKSLLREQGYICCYCGKRIELDHFTKLEHLLCRKEHEELQLDYNNILASCDGGQEERSGLSLKEKKRVPPHCDAKKGSEKLDISPLCPDCEDRFLYDEDGYIYGQNEAAQNAISTLGLNCHTIKNRRRYAIEAYTIFRDFPELTEEKPDFWKLKLEYNSTRDSKGRYPEYCFAVRYFIKEYCLQSIE